MALISFSCASPLASWSPSVNPRYGGGYAQNEEHFQPKGFAGANLYSYSHGHAHGRTLEWGMLPAADMATLLTFMGLMKGGRYPFSFTDYDAAVYTACRILNFQNFPFKNRTLTYYETMLELEVA
jgi:hypothetical protein